MSWLGGCHVAHPHRTGAGEHQLGGSTRNHPCLQTNLSPLKEPLGYVPSSTEGASRHGHHRHGYQHHSPRWGKRLCPSLPPLLPSGASPLGRRAEGGWGDWVGQPAQPGQREGQWLSTARGSGHAEVPQRSSEKHAMAARGRREWGHAEGLGACRQIHASVGRKV